MFKMDRHDRRYAKEPVEADYLYMLGNPKRNLLKLILAVIIYIGIFCILVAVSTIIFKNIINILAPVLKLERLEDIETLTDSYYFEKLTDWLLFMAVPASILTYMCIYKKKAGELASIEGKFRWEWSGKCLLFLFPVIGFFVIGQTLLDGVPEIKLSKSVADAIFLSTIFTPLQAMGEEYLFRGFALQIMGTLTKPGKDRWIIFSIVSSFVFSVAHNPGDLLAGIDFFVFGILMCGLVYFTGGLEAGIVFHTLNNLFLNIMADLTGGNIDFSINEVLEEKIAIEGAIISIISDIIVFVIIIYIWKRYRRKSEGKKTGVKIT